MREFPEPDSPAPSDLLEIARRIRVLRGQFVLLDVDLADLFCVSPQHLAEVVRRANVKLPDEFVMLTPSESAQVVRVAFTEHGVIMAAAVMNDPYAVEISIRIVRAFVSLREAEPSGRELH